MEEVVVRERPNFPKGYEPISSADGFVYAINFSSNSAYLTSEPSFEYSVVVRDETIDAFLTTEASLVFIKKFNIKVVGQCLLIPNIYRLSDTNLQGFEAVADKVKEVRRYQYLQDGMVPVQVGEQIYHVKLHKLKFSDVYEAIGPDGKICFAECFYQPTEPKTNDAHRGSGNWGRFYFHFYDEGFGQEELERQYAEALLEENIARLDARLNRLSDEAELARQDVLTGIEKDLADVEKRVNQIESRAEYDRQRWLTEEEVHKELLEFASSLEYVKNNPEEIVRIRTIVTCTTPLLPVQQHKIDLLVLAQLYPQMNFNAPLVAHILVYEFLNTKYFHPEILSLVTLLNTQKLQKISRAEREVLLAYLKKNEKAFSSFPTYQAVIALLERPLSVEFAEDFGQLVVLERNSIWEFKASFPLFDPFKDDVRDISSEDRAEMHAFIVEKQKKLKGFMEDVKQKLEEFSREEKIIAKEIKKLTEINSFVSGILNKKYNLHRKYEKVYVVDLARREADSGPYAYHAYVFDFGSGKFLTHDIVQEVGMFIDQEKDLFPKKVREIEQPSAVIPSKDKDEISANNTPVAQRDDVEAVPVEALQEKPPQKKRSDEILASLEKRPYLIRTIDELRNLEWDFELCRDYLSIDDYSKTLGEIQKCRALKERMVAALRGKSKSFDFEGTHKFIRIPKKNPVLFLVVNLKQLGEGSFGKVYEARFINTKTGELSREKYAVKEFRENFSSAGIEEERKGDKKLFPTALAFRDQGCSYIVTECIEGNDLASERIAEQNSEGFKYILTVTEAVRELNLHQRLKAIQLMASQLTKLHHTTNRGKGRLHGDIRPDNVRVFINNGDLKDIQLVDFSFSREINSVDELINDRSGSDGYFSPERYDGKKGAKSDVYSWAAIVMILLGAENPARLKVLHPENRNLKYDRTGLFENIKDALNQNTVISPEIQGLASAFLDKMENADYVARADSEEVLRFFTAWYQYENPGVSPKDKNNYLKTMQCMVDPELILNEQNVEQNFKIFPHHVQWDLFEHVSKANSESANAKRSFIINALSEKMSRDMNAFSARQTLYFLNSIQKTMQPGENLAQEPQEVKVVKETVLKGLTEKYQHLFYFNAKRRAARNISKAIRGQSSMFFKPTKYVDKVLNGKANQAELEVIDQLLVSAPKAAPAA